MGHNILKESKTKLQGVIFNIFFNVAGFSFIVSTTLINITKFIFKNIVHLILKQIPITNLMRRYQITVARMHLRYLTSFIIPPNLHYYENGLQSYIP